MEMEDQHQVTIVKTDPAQSPKQINDFIPFKYEFPIDEALQSCQSIKPPGYLSPSSQASAIRIPPPPPFCPVSFGFNTPTKTKGLAFPEFGSTADHDTPSKSRYKSMEKSGYETQSRLLVGHFNTNRQTSTPLLLPIYIYFDFSGRTRRPVYLYTLSGTPNDPHPPSSISAAEYTSLGFTRQSKTNCRNQQVDIEPWVVFDAAFQIGPLMPRFVNKKDWLYKRFWVEYKKLGRTGRKKTGRAGSARSRLESETGAGFNPFVKDEMDGTSGMGMSMDYNNLVLCDNMLGKSGGYGYGFSGVMSGAPFTDGLPYDFPTTLPLSPTNQPVVSESVLKDRLNANRVSISDMVDLDALPNMGDTEMPDEFRRY